MAKREVIVFVSILVLVVAILAAILAYAIPPVLVIVAIAVVLGAIVLSPRLAEFKEFERGIIFRFGKFSRVAGPGWVFFWPAFESFVLTDLRVTIVDLPEQDVITRDDVEIKVDAVIYEKIVDPKKAIIEIKDFKTSMRELLKSQIRNTVSKMELEEVLEKTEEIGNDLQTVLKGIAQDWGISVIKVEVQAIRLPPSLITAMHKRREAGEYKMKLETEAQAKQVSLEILNKATSMLDEKTMSVLYIEALKAVANGKATKLVVPLELADMARSLSGKMSFSKNSSLENVIANALQLKKS